MSQETREVIAVALIYGVPALLLFVFRKHLRWGPSRRRPFDDDRRMQGPAVNVDGSPMAGGSDIHGRPFGVYGQPYEITRNR